MADNSSPNAQRQVGVLAIIGMAARVASQSMTLALLLLAGRFLSVELFGIFVLSSILMNFAVMQMYSGIYHYVLREPGFEESKGTALSLQVLYGLAFSVIILLSAGLVYLANWGDLLAVLIAATSAMPILAVIGSWQEANVLRSGDVKFYYGALVSSEIIGFLIGVGMLMAGFEIWSLIASRYCTAVIVAAILTLKSGLPGKLEWDRRSIRQIVNYSLALYGNSFLAFVTAYGAAIVLGGFLNAKAVGLYRMGSRTAGAAYDVFAQTFRVLTWQAVGRMARENRLSPNLWIRMVALNFSIMTFALGSLSILAEDLTLVLLGPEWLGMVPVLQIICIVKVLASVDQIGAAQLAAVGETRFLLRARLVQVATLTCSLLITVQFGMVAVALGLFPPTLVYLFLMLRKLIRFTEIDTATVVEAVAPGFLISACGLVTVFLLSILFQNKSAFVSIPAIATIGLGVYIGVAFIPLRNWTVTSLQTVSTAILPRHSESPAQA